MSGAALFWSVVLGLVLLAMVAWELHKRRVKARTETLWPGGHVVSPVRRLGPDYGDGGSYEWRWRCKYCHEEHRTKDRFSGECEL